MPVASNPAALALALRGYSPIIQAAIARSKYAREGLEEPLPGDMKSPLELALRLGAKALYMKADKDANKGLADALRQDSADKWKGMAAVLGEDPAQAATPQAPPQEAPAVPPQASAPQVAAPSMAEASKSSFGRQLDDKRRDMLARLLIGEESTDDGQRGVASVVLNRSDEAGMDPMDVMTQKGQFEPYGNKKRWSQLLSLSPDDPAYQRAAANVDAVLQNGPTTGADHFYAPKAQAALGRPMPSWDNGSGQDIGKSRFLDIGFNAPPGYQRQAQAAPTWALNAAAAAPQAQPVQMPAQPAPQAPIQPPAPSAAP
jgi:hypothetical protein